ncbi:MAG TPA: hypothetical protein PKE65_10345, partial [Rhizobiaceae bacterium]|nr:hypothetical protein [Rhizobiaceae bacterium]
STADALALTTPRAESPSAGLCASDGVITAKPARIAKELLETYRIVNRSCSVGPHTDLSSLHEQAQRRANPPPIRRLRDRAQSRAVATRTRD